MGLGCVKTPYWLLLRLATMRNLLGMAISRIFSITGLGTSLMCLRRF